MLPFHGLRGSGCFGPFIPLLLITRLEGIISFKQRLRYHPYPKASETHLTLPCLPAQDRNLNRFPF